MNKSELDEKITLKVRIEQQKRINNQALELINAGINIREAKLMLQKIKDINLLMNNVELDCGDNTILRNTIIGNDWSKYYITEMALELIIN